MAFVIVFENKTKECDTFSQLLKILEKNITLANVSKITVVLPDHHYPRGFNTTPGFYAGIYNFNEIATQMFSQDYKYYFDTTTIATKLKQLQQPPTEKKKYIFLDNNNATYQTANELVTVIKSNIATNTINLTKIIDVDTMKIYNYEHGEGKMLSYVNEEVALNEPALESLYVNYKILLIYVENKNNPFKLSKKYICEKKIIPNTLDESTEMDKYHISTINKEFKYDDIKNFIIAKILIVKNDIIIGEIKNNCIFYKGKKLYTLTLGPYFKCGEILHSYENSVGPKAIINNINDIKNESKEYFQKIFYNIFNKDIKDDKNFIKLINLMNTLNNFD